MYELRTKSLALRINPAGGWGHEAARRGHNHVLANKIERVLLSGRCCDGGAIYTLGPQPGSSLQGNYLYHAEIERPGYGPLGHGGAAMYLRSPARHACLANNLELKTMPDGCFTYRCMYLRYARIS